MNSESKHIPKEIKLIPKVLVEEKRHECQRANSHPKAFQKRKGMNPGERTHTQYQSLLDLPWRTTALGFFFTLKRYGMVI